MDGFIAKVKKDRSTLQELHIVIRARTTAFIELGLTSKDIFEFDYVKHKPAKSISKNKVPSTAGTRDMPIDVEDFASTAPNKTAKVSAPAESKTVIDQSVVDTLYEAMLEWQEMAMDGSGSEDSFDETDAEIEMMQERAEEMYGSEGDEDEYGRRPRWAAF